MRVPYGWLISLCDPGLGPDALAERLSMTGTEVERVTRLGVSSADGFVVGEVLSAEPHPNADRLSVCEVDAGEGEARTIVCGAPNVAAGQTVAVALPGAVMPDGTKLGKAKLRGVESSGMILSETEMELGEDSSGIAVLDAGEPGTPLRDGAADRRDGARARDHAQPARLPRRPRRRPRGARDHGRRAGAGPVGHRRRVRRATTTSPITPPCGSRCRTCARASPRAPSRA